MGSEQILLYVVALILGMLLANMLKGVCGCKVVEGQRTDTMQSDYEEISSPTNVANQEREVMSQNR